MAVRLKKGPGQCSRETRRSPKLKTLKMHLGGKLEQEFHLVEGLFGFKKRSALDPGPGERDRCTFVR